MPRGGKRDGAGRPRRHIPRGILVPPVVLLQLMEIAQVEGVPLEEVVKEAILSFIADWQAEHDSARHAVGGN